MCLDPRNTDQLTYVVCATQRHTVHQKGAKKAPLKALLLVTKLMFQVTTMAASAITPAPVYLRQPSTQVQ
jgi:hypothetical protein